MFPGEGHRRHFAGAAAFAETAGHQDAVDILKIVDDAFRLECFGVDPSGVDAHIIGDAAVSQGLGQGFIGIDQAGVFADDGDAHLALGLADALDDGLPASQVRRGLVGDAEARQNLGVEAGLVIADRHLIDGVHIERRYDRLLAHIAEQGDLVALRLGQFTFGAAQQDVGLDADAAQLLHRMLGRLGLEFARRLEIGH